ncbi:MAG: IPT/TIG domain-containing protein [Dehalococcoidia bacterium]
MSASPSPVRAAPRAAPTTSSNYLPPTVSSVAPTYGLNTTSTSVTVTGTNFSLSGGTSVKFGSVASPSVSCSTTTSCTAASPVVSSHGPVDIQASATSLADQFLETIPMADVNGDGSISPLDAPCVLRFVAGLPFTMNGPNPLPHPDVNQDQHVTPLDAQCLLRYIAAFLPTAGCPVALPGILPQAPTRRLQQPSGPAQVSLSPATATLATGSSTTLNLQLTAPTAGIGSYIVDVAYDPSVVTPTDCTPAGPGLGICNTAYGAGTLRTVGVSSSGLTLSATNFTDPGGSPVTTTTSNGQLTVQCPAVTALSPTGGAYNGGTPVTITGSGFSTTAGATGVSFGTVAAGSVSCSSTTSYSATSPAGLGVVAVRVTVGGNTSPTTAADQFSDATGSGGAITSPTPGSVPRWFRVDVHLVGQYLTVDWLYAAAGSGGGQPGIVIPSSPITGATGVGTTPMLVWTAPVGVLAGTTQYTVHLVQSATPPSRSGPGNASPRSGVAVAARRSKHERGPNPALAALRLSHCAHSSAMASARSATCSL